MVYMLTATVVFPETKTRKSKSGYVIFLNEPILWNSKLQTTVALSTSEAELMAISSRKERISSYDFMINKRMLFSNENFKLKLRAVN